MHWALLLRRRHSLRISVISRVHQHASFLQFRGLLRDIDTSHASWMAFMVVSVIFWQAELLCTQLVQVPPGFYRGFPPFSASARRDLKDHCNVNDDRSHDSRTSGMLWMSPNSGLPGSSVRSFQRLAVPWCLDRATHTQTPSRWNRSHNLPLHGLLNGVFQVPEFTLKLLHLIVRGELDTSQRRSFALDPDVSCFSSILPDPEHGRVRDLNRRCLDRSCLNRSMSASLSCQCC